MTKNLRVIHTRHHDGTPNGFLVPIWHVDDGYKPQQVYLTTIAPGCQKGPHLHKKRRGAFTCIQGQVRIVTRSSGGVYHYVENKEGEFRTVFVDPGVPTALYNLGNTDAYIINMPSPAWREEEQDDWPVDDWQYEP
jgi:dTDP-4-dehydrorhamnose 3,5-epimerase-like enzyme